MSRPDAVEAARRAGRLLSLVPALRRSWARTHDDLSRTGDPATVAAADLAVGRLCAVVEDEVDRSYLIAFAAAHASMAVATSRPRSDAAADGGYAAVATVVADHVPDPIAGCWRRRARHLRRLAADLRASADLARRMHSSSAASPPVRLEDWNRLAGRWEAIARGEIHPYPLPPEPPQRMVFHDGDRVVIHTGSTDDRVQVDGDRDTGEWRVVVNGHVSHYAAGTAITVRTGAGDDHITVTGPTGVTVLGGPGDDVVRGGDGDDVILGGPGRDYLDGGGGHDLLSGGPGNDVLYGAGGDDLLDGGEGRDYVDGGEGDDIVRGGPGDDVLVGGPGADVVHGGGGADIAYLTPGDRPIGVEAETGTEPMELPAAIKVRGSADFVARVRADLHVLATSPVGRRMLTALGRPPASAERVDAIVIIEDEVSSASWTTLDLPTGRRFSVLTVAYRTDRGVSSDRTPPIIALFHELAHVYDFVHRTVAEGTHDDPRDPGAPNDERAAVGLPIDHDGDPATPHRIHPDHPYELTENALRDEMGLPRRDRYGD